MLCSSTLILNKEACIICQSREGALHKVAFDRLKMLDVAKTIVDPSLFLRLNNIPNASDAIENNINTICHDGSL